MEGRPMNEQIRELVHIAADTLPVWRDGVVVLLALLVIGLLALAAVAYGWGE
jgi:hypothetical protein